MALRDALLLGLALVRISWNLPDRRWNDRGTGSRLLHSGLAKDRKCAARDSCQLHLRFARNGLPGAADADVWLGLPHLRVDRPARVYERQRLLVDAAASLHFVDQPAWIVAGRNLVPRYLCGRSMDWDLLGGDLFRGPSNSEPPSASLGACLQHSGPVHQSLRLAPGCLPLRHYHSASLNDQHR